MQSLNFDQFDTFEWPTIAFYARNALFGQISFRCA